MSVKPVAGVSAEAIHCEHLSLSHVTSDEHWWQTSPWMKKRLPVLHDVSLSLPEGAVMGLVGRNGAGKSTLMRCLVGLTAPDQGASELLGCPSLALSDEVRERLGYVAQTPDLFGGLNGQEHLSELGRVYSRFDFDHALRLALMLDLPMGTRADQLSLGDQQKLSVVLALAHHPDLLILDEPVASLDPLARRDFMRALFDDQALRQHPRSVLISSHLLSDLERVVTHVCFLRKGQVQLIDEWDALLEHLRLVVQEHPITDAGLISQRSSQGRIHALVDLRRSEAPQLYAHGRELRMEDLFVELNA